MTLSDLSIRRPVFAWMLMLGLILFGAMSFKNLGVSQMPDVDFPVVSVSITWEGAAPEVMEAEVVDRLEEAVISVEGIKEIVSTVRQGRATLSLEFDLDRDIDAALQEVQSSISQVRLPTDVDPPTIKKSNPEDQPILWVGIGGNRSLRDLIAYVELKVKDQFQIIPGVGEVMLGGFTERNLRVWVDNEKLKKHELTVLDVQRAISQGHLETAAGIIENSTSELNVRVLGEGVTTEQVGDLLITERGGRPIFNSQIRLRDVARIEDGLNDVRRVSRISGAPGIGIGIKKQRGANAVKIGELVKKRIEELSRTLPSDLQMQVNFDSTVFVKESIEETEFTLVLSAIVTALVCWLFLGSWRPTFNILLSIPTSIIGAFIFIDLFGFTLNLFTILGLALSIGIVVDDAIMVLENIYRHKAMGKDKVQAARDGAREITFAAVAASIAVVAIFLPVAFMSGVIGKFFFQFGITISAAVMLSLLEAITLTPMRCSQLMDEEEGAGRFAQFLNRMFLRLSGFYGGLLKISLQYRFVVIMLSIAIFSGSLLFVKPLRKEFVPPQDQSIFITRFQTPVGSSLEFTGEVLTKAESFLKSRPEVIRYFTSIGGFGGGEVNTGMIFVTLTPPKERTLSQGDFMNVVRKELGKIPNVKIFTQDLSTRGFTAQRGYPIDINIRGSDWGILSEKALDVARQLETSGLAVDVDTDYRLGMPEVQVIPKRAEAAVRGVSIEDLTATISTAIGGVRQGKFTNDGRRYDVRIRLESEERSSADAIKNLYVRNQFGEMVRVSDLVEISTKPTLQTITRRNRERSVSIYANIATGASQSEALSVAQKIAEKDLPEGYRVFLGGGAQTFLESFESLFFVLWLGLAVAYMILASQFNSYIHPVTVLLALPFSITGALAALWLTDQSINLYSMIGIILLMGIVKKNSILLVEFANVKREEGLEVSAALLEAGRARLRPILMTSVATIAAAIPPALAIGPGAESRIPMSITIIGGVLISTLFTLFVVPCAYKVFSRFESRT